MNIGGDVRAAIMVETETETAAREWALAEQHAERERELERERQLARAERLECERLEWERQACIERVDPLRNDPALRAPMESAGDYYHATACEREWEGEGACRELELGLGWRGHVASECGRGYGHAHAYGRGYGYSSPAVRLR